MAPKIDPWGDTFGPKADLWSSSPFRALRPGADLGVIRCQKRYRAAFDGVVIPIPIVSWTEMVPKNDPFSDILFPKSDFWSRPQSMWPIYIYIYIYI